MYEEKINKEVDQNSLSLENDKFKLLTEAIQLNTIELKTLKSKLAYIKIEEVVELNKTVASACETFNKSLKFNEKNLSLNSDFHTKLKNIENSIETKMLALVSTIPHSVTVNKKISLDNSPKSLVSLFGFLVVLITVILAYQVFSSTIDKIENRKYRNIYNKVYQHSSPRNQKIMDEIYYNENQ